MTTDANSLYHIAEIACTSILITDDAYELDVPLKFKITLNVAKNVWQRVFYSTLN